MAASLARVSVLTARLALLSKTVPRARVFPAATTIRLVSPHRGLNMHSHVSASSARGMSIMTAAGVVVAVTATTAAACAMDTPEMPDSVADEITGVVFARSYTATSPVAVGTTASLSLLGLGTRTISFLNVPVYTLGFYVNRGALLPALSGARALAAGEDVLSARVQDAVVQTTPVALVIQPVRPTQLSHMRDGFCTALTKRVKLIAGDADKAAAQAEIEAFRQLFPRGDIGKGEFLSIEIDPVTHTLTLAQNGKVFGRAALPFVAKALPKSYIDDLAASTNVRKSVRAGLQQWLA